MLWDLDFPLEHLKSSSTSETIILTTNRVLVSFKGPTTAVVPNSIQTLRKQGKIPMRGPPIQFGIVFTVRFKASNSDSNKIDITQVIITNTIIRKVI